MRLSDGMLITESNEYNAAFPAKRFAHVSLLLKDGTRLTSPRTEARGDPEAHVSDNEIHAKFHGIADERLDSVRASCLMSVVSELGDKTDLSDFNRAIYDPI